jgi:hypothetical protein
MSRVKMHRLWTIVNISWRADSIGFDLLSVTNVQDSHLTSQENVQVVISLSLFLEQAEFLTFTVVHNVKCSSVATLFDSGCPFAFDQHVCRYTFSIHLFYITM